MKKNLVYSVLLLGSCSMQSMHVTVFEDPEKFLVTLPSAEIIAQHLAAHNGFLAATKLHNNLGGKKLYPTGAVIAVDNALYGYGPYHNKIDNSVPRKDISAEIIVGLLAGNSEAIKHLQSCNILPKDPTQ